MRARPTIWLAVPLGLTAAAFLASQTALAAFDTPPMSSKLSSGCTSLTSGNSCDYTFQWFASDGTPDQGLNVSFTDPHVSGCSINPTSGTTSSNGTATTTLSCAAGSGSGTETITASGCQPTTSNCASATANVSINPAAGAATTLPFTGTELPGPSAWLIAAIVAAALILVGAGVALVRSGRIRRPV